ncbi:MAG: hypothetical protein IIA55_02160 [Gemmatimonadetes bacterium]|nr:hypothetical protein [Gemmatimonadota bacterium]
MSKQIIRAKVVSILDNQRIVINAGIEQGVQAGDQFFLYEEGAEITDPENEEPLGRLENIKAHTEAFLVQEKMTVLLPVLSKQSNSSSVLSVIL